MGNGISIGLCRPISPILIDGHVKQFNNFTWKISIKIHLFAFNELVLKLVSNWRLLIHNTLRPRQNGRHFADDVFKCIFWNGNLWISIKISLKFVPKGPINNIPALVQIMAWRRPGDKPLSEPMMVSLTTHICVTRPQWVNKYVQRQEITYAPQLQWWWPVGYQGKFLSTDMNLDMDLPLRESQVRR